MLTKGCILLIEDDETFRSFLQTILEDEGYEVRLAGDGREGDRVLARESFDLVITDLKMPGKSGLELFRETRQDPGSPPFIFLTAFGTVDEAVAAMKEGAVDFLTKPLAAPEALLSLVARTMESQTRNRAFLSLKEAEAAGLPPEELVFAGQVMQTLRKMVYDVAATTANVLVCGESGTGKELVARTVHLLSPRSRLPFVALNCAAIPENLLESELFGHERGAFTGALQARQGKFELAAGGTIFLDEVGEMPPAVQAKMLRVIQERVFERVGGRKEIKADVRIIAATNRHLEDEVAARRFREDLYYRLNVFPLLLPPLRERLDALPALVDFFLQRFCRQLNKKLQRIEPEVLRAMRSHPWPGNVRELQNVMERAAILAHDCIRPEHLPESLFNRQVQEKPGGSRDMLRSMEREMIVKALQKNRGNRRLTADELGISRRTLQYRLREYDLIGET